MARRTRSRREVERLRADFESVTGKPFEYFYCPILHVDEDVPLTKGHVVPDSLGGRSTVLQRTDVDNGFGAFVEAEAGDAVMYGLDRNPLDVLLRGDPSETAKIGRRFKIRLQFEDLDQGIDIACRKVHDEMALVAATGDLRRTLGEPDGQTNFRGWIGVELDARSSILVTSLRTTHLNWFQKCGYRYVFSNEGVFVAWVLRSFYQNFIEPRRGPNRVKRGSLISDKIKREVDDYCFQFANFIRPLPRSSVDTMPEEVQRGTPDSGWFMVLWDDDQIYGRISVVRLGGQHIGVVTPIITDARGWALFDLAANLELEFSFGRFDMEAKAFRVDDRPRWRTVWSSVDETTRSVPAIPIRRAAEVVLQSGRMDAA